MNEEKNNFLPSGYEVPEATSNYARFQDGINRFRVLSSAITGYEYFTSENKPCRSREPFESTPDLKKNGKVKVFWAFVCWNFNVKKIQILKITQKTIITAIKSLIDNPSWGNPINKYTIVIKKTGEGLDTEYSVMPEPHSETEQEIIDEFMSKEIDLSKLFTGENPFVSEK